MIAFDWLAALLALFALRPLRARLARVEEIPPLKQSLVSSESGPGEQ